MELCNWQYYRIIWKSCKKLKHVHTKAHIIYHNITYMLHAYIDLFFVGKMFARRVLSRCWDGILDVLSVLLNGKSSCGITSSLGLLLGTEGAKEESLRAREAICTSLNGLQKAARLCCTLGMYHLYQLKPTAEFLLPLLVFDYIN